MKKFLPLAILVLLTGCLTPPTYVAPPVAPLLTDPAQVALVTKVSHDDFKKTTSFEGANSSQHGTQIIRGWKDDKEQKANFQIYTVSYYDGQWRFYNEAFDSEGNKFEFTSIDRKVESCAGSYGCFYREVVGLTVSRKYLEDHSETGIHYKVSGKAGEFVGTIPPAYVKGFILSVDQSHL